MKKTLLILALMLGMASHAQANPNASNQADAIQKKYNQMDTNLDGKVTIEEFKALYPTMKSNVFDIIDSNNDNVIDTKEWEAFQLQHTMDMKREQKKEKPHQMSSGDGGRGVDQGLPPTETHPGGTMLISPPGK